MPRKPRRESGTGIYHVVSRGLDKESIFRTKEEKDRMWKNIWENVKKYRIKIYAYCIMSNHLHLLVKVDLKNLSLFMAKILAAYAQYYNYKHNRIGYVFQERFRSQCIESEAYFWNCIRYIHLNPVKAKMCKNPANYPYSSLTEYMDVKEKKLLDSESYELLRSRFYSRREFEKFHRSSCGDFFIDIQEEEFQERKAIAEEILGRMETELELSAGEILDYVKARNLFEKEMKKTFGISKKKVQQIRNIIKMELTQKKN